MALPPGRVRTYTVRTGERGRELPRLLRPSPSPPGGRPARLLDGHRPATGPGVGGPRPAGGGLAGRGRAPRHAAQRVLLRRRAGPDRHGRAGVRDAARRHGGGRRLDRARGAGGPDHPRGAARGPGRDLSPLRRSLAPAVPGRAVGRGARRRGGRTRAGRRPRARGPVVAAGAGPRPPLLRRGPPRRPVAGGVPGASRRSDARVRRPHRRARGPPPGAARCSRPLVPGAAGLRCGDAPLPAPAGRPRRGASRGRGGARRAGPTPRPGGWGPWPASTACGC